MVMKTLEFLREIRNASALFTEKDRWLIEKQLRGLALTQPERNRLSQSIRPKLREIARITDTHIPAELPAGLLRDEKINQTVKQLRQDRHAKQLRAVLLFGSHARNEAHPQSDIDLCAIYDPGLSRKQATALRLHTHPPEGIDLRVFNTLPPDIRKEIAHDGKVVWSRGFDRPEFISTTLRSAEDDAQAVTP